MIVEKRKKTDLLAERLCSLAEAAKAFPKKARPSIPSLWRWTRTGKLVRTKDGPVRIKLDSISLSGRLFTSLESINRFIIETNVDNK
jgi:hypothetical protein